MKFYPYGIWVACAAAAGLVLLAVQEKRRSLKPGTASWIAVTALPLGLLGARLLFCLMRLTWFLEQGFGWFFRLNEGGFMMYGALGGLLLAVLITSKWTKQRFGAVLDAAAPPAMLALGLGRIGDLVAGQGYGWPLEDWFSVDALDPEEYSGMSLFHTEDTSFFERLPFAVEDPYYGNYRWAVCILIGVIAVALFVVLWRMKPRREGSLSIMALAMTASLTALCESMRQDDLMRWGVVRMGQILSAVLLAVLLLICQRRMAPPRDRKSLILEWVSLLAAMGLVMATEFMLEKKIVFLDFIPMDVCYVLMILACVWMTLSIRAAWRKQDRA